MQCQGRNRIYFTSREYQQLIFSWYHLVLDWATNEIQVLFLGFYKYISWSNLSLFIHHSSIYFQYTPIDSDGKRGFSMEWAKVSLWHLSSNGVTKTIYFFLVDISDIHSVSDHSILKYEALSYHGRSLRALSDYLLPYFPSNENKSMLSLAFKIQEFSMVFSSCGTE